MSGYGRGLGRSGVTIALMLAATAGMTRSTGRIGAKAQGAVDPSPGSARRPAAAVPADVLRHRRAALLERFDPGVAVIRSADARGDLDYAQDADFRQDNDFYYLTGLETPGSWLVMFRRAVGDDSTVLYVPERDPGEETWTGRQPGLEEAASWSGVEVVRPASAFEDEFLARLSAPNPHGTPPRLYVPLGASLARSRDLVERALSSRYTVEDLSDVLASLRLVKDSVELARLATAAAITAEAQRQAMRMGAAGQYEYQLEAWIEYVFRCNGAERVGFPSIVGSGPNSVILHYDTNRRRMEDGDLVVIDIGAEYGYYTADVTRTIPIGGRFTDRQRAIYDLVLATQQAVIDSIRPGATFRGLSTIARRYMREHSNDLCGEAGCDAYFIHAFGHWLGMDVHDVGDYRTPLAPGMVLTVEPGIYLPEEDLGVRIEDDVRVTRDGHDVLSGAAPRRPEEIERLMSSSGDPLPRCDL